MGKLRCTANTKICVNKANGDIVNEKFAYGRHYDAKKLVIYEDGYADAHLSNGDVIYGIDACLFEVYNVPIERV